VPPILFPIRVGRRSRGFLRLWGVTGDRPPVVRLNDELDVEFGRFRFRTPVANIASWRIEGPWRWITAIGVRRSVRHGDVSFAGSPRGGVRLDFRDRVRAGIFRVPAVYVGVDDLEPRRGAQEARNPGRRRAQERLKGAAPARRAGHVSVRRNWG
jgi:hypothetical protein